MFTAYRYHRFSTKSQDRGSSIERQADATMSMIVANGWIAAPGDPLEDRGRSAWKGDHLKSGALGEFKRRVDAGEIAVGSVLVIENLDRLSRENVKKARRWIEEVTESGVLVAVASLNKIFDEASLSGENIVDLLQYLIEAQRSHAESARKSVFRTKINEQHIEKAKRGEVITSRAPVWLRQLEGKWEPCPVRAPIIQQIYEWSADGLGYAAICKKLNATFEPWTQGWKTGRSEWKVGYVRDILCSPSVEGEFHRKAAGEDRVEVITGYYPRVVPADLVERARMAKSSRVKTGGRFAPEGRNLFAGRMLCAKCGGTMVKMINHNQRKVRYHYVMCRAARGGSCTQTVQFRYDKFEAAALREILHLTLDNQHFTKTEETGPIVSRIANLKKQIALVQGELDELVRIVRLGHSGRTIVADLDRSERIVDQLHGELLDAEKDLERAQGQVSPAEHIRRVLEIREAITSDDPEVGQQARRMVRTAFQSVIQSIKFSGQKIGQRKYARTITMRLVGGHFTIWFDGDGNVKKKRDHLDVFEHNRDGVFSKLMRHGIDEAGEAILTAQVRRAGGGPEGA